MVRHDVFVSYSSLDKPIAAGLRFVLQRAGHTTWFDASEVRAGDPIPDTLRNALRNCRFLCAVITPNYGKTWYTRMEAEFMKSREGIMAPVRVIPCLFGGEVPAFLGERNYVDFRASPQQAEKQLLSALASHRKVQDDRGNLAMLGGVAAVASFFVWALSGESEEQIRERRTFQGKLLALANHQALGRFLRARDIPVPSKKVDRVDAVLDAVPIEEALDELFSSETLKTFCEGLGLDAGQSKADRIAAIAKYSKS